MNIALVTGMDEFLGIFGSVTVGQVVTFVLACVFLFVIGKKIVVYFNNKIELEKKRDKDIETALAEVAKYPQYRKQSIAVQQELQGEINVLKEAIDKNTRKMEEIETGNKTRELNRIRNKLIESYNYYTSERRNPTKSWTEMESQSFWSMFLDYEDLGGDGFIHTTVEPEMRALEVIDMNDFQRITEAMKSRG